MMFQLKRDFRIFDNYRSQYGHSLVYLDAAATTQRPNCVIDAEVSYLTACNAAAHRGVARLSQSASDAYERSRATVSRFVGCDASEVVFTKNATEGINLVAYSLANVAHTDPTSKYAINPGDEIVVTELEHHANLVPWQQLCIRTGTHLKWIECDQHGQLCFEDALRKIGPRCKLLALTQQSNATGAIVDVKPLIALAKSVGALVLVDACQSASKMRIEFSALDADFVVFSGHKLLGPTGIGVLAGKRSVLEALPPFLYGGSMIDQVSMEKTTFASDVPRRFEPGVPPTSQAVALAAAIEYLEKIGMENIWKHEVELTALAVARLSEIDEVMIYGGAKKPEQHAGVVAFNLADLHPHDVGQALDESHVVVRVGHHCAKPLQRRLHVPGTVRASFYVYNDEEDVDSLVTATKSSVASFKRLGLLRYAA